MTKSVAHLEIQEDALSHLLKSMNSGISLLKQAAAMLKALLLNAKLTPSLLILTLALDFHTSTPSNLPKTLISTDGCLSI